MYANIGLSYHSRNQSDANRIYEYLSYKDTYRILMLTESVPINISIKTKIIQDIDALIVITSRFYQKSVECMEFISYARLLDKPIFSVNTYSNYRPFGGLGYLCAGSRLSLVNLWDNYTFCESLEKIITEIDEILQIKIKKVKKEKAKRRAELGLAPEDDDIEEELERSRLRLQKSDTFVLSRSLSTVVKLNYTDTKVDVLISAHNLDYNIAKVIKEGLSKNLISCLDEDSSTGVTNIRSSKLIIVVMSEDYEENFNCRATVEEARLLGKQIIPVLAEENFKPKKWLGMVSSGKFWYNIFSKKKAYTKQFDSIPMNELITAVILAVNPRENLNQKYLLLSLKAQIEDYKNSFLSWPPLHRRRILKEEKPVKANITEPRKYKTNKFFTRDQLVIPGSLFDNQCQPLREVIDCMISYDEKAYEFAKGIYMELCSKDLTVWIDLWNREHSNTNEIMATAIESSRVIVVILSENYQDSIYCQHDFKYSIMRGKPFVFVKNQNDLYVEQWIKSQLKEYPSFDVIQLDDLNKEENGISQLDRLTHAIKEIGSVQPKFKNCELSEDIVRLRELIDDALDEINGLGSRSRYRICTRCRMQFDIENPSGCKFHSGYFIDKQTSKIFKDQTFSRTRWVCCNNTSKTSVGCMDTNHIEIDREWKFDPRYGTYSWDPK